MAGSSCCMQMHKASQRLLQGTVHCLVLPVTMQLGKCLCTGHIEEEEEEEKEVKEATRE